MLVAEPTGLVVERVNGLAAVPVRASGSPTRSRARSAVPSARRRRPAGESVMQALQLAAAGSAEGLVPRRSLPVADVITVVVDAIPAAALSAVAAHRVGRRRWTARAVPRAAVRCRAAAVTAVPVPAAVIAVAAAHGPVAVAVVPVPVVVVVAAAVVAVAAADDARS